MSDKKCFIIMPVTTPSEMISNYNGDDNHFIHIMEELFIPAIVEAGFDPIKPITTGSEIIHGHIISNLESSDLVLCDMSIYNSNVFFELGIRTALNKPVCLVKDNITEKMPFDTAIINCYTYSQDLSSWIVKQEIKNLTKHINDSFSKSDNCNSLWKYLGFRSFATPPEKLSGDSDKLDYLILQIDAMRRQLNVEREEKMVKISREVFFLLSNKYGVVFPAGFGYGFSSCDNKLNILASRVKDIPVDAIKETKEIGSKYGIEIEIKTDI